MFVVFTCSATSTTISLSAVTCMNSGFVSSSMSCMLTSGITGSHNASRSAMARITTLAKVNISICVICRPSMPAEDPLPPKMRSTRP